ncbi:outer membrane protein [Treponema sp. UBA3813]|uniref:outer membrane protein n=1 Tax=Treponema sp. UBA3813 TaxID=1947715 RepID=UPI0025F4DF52|nr:hypothetical protein [Treponema sp. UBA3813]
MQKKIYPFLFLIFSAIALFGQSYSGKTIVIKQPDDSAITSVINRKEERDNMNAGIRANFESNFSQYLQMQITVDENEAKSAMEILKRESESNMYSEDSGPELGSFSRTFFTLDTKILRSGSGFQLTVTISDLETGKRETVVSQKAYTKENLTSHPGAVDDITILISDRLGIPLSHTDRTTLRVGFNNLNTDQKIESTNSQLARINKQMEELRQKKQSASNAKNTDQERNIEAQIEDLRIRQRQQEETAERLRKDKERMEYEKALDEGRSEEQKNKFLAESREAEQAAATLRAKKIESKSLYSYFTTAENKKQLLLEFQAKMNERVAQIKADGEKEIKEKRQSIMNAPYKYSEMSNGKPVDEAYKQRVQEADVAENEIRDEMARFTQDAKVPYQKQMNVLISEIVDEYEQLEFRPFVVSTVNNPEELQYVVEDFDRKKMGWPVKFYYYSDGVLIGSFKTIIPYKELYKAMEGKEAPLPTGSIAERKAFDDAVDLFQKHFSYKSNIINYILTFESEAVLDVPSRYSTEFIRLDMKVTKTDDRFYTDTEFAEREPGKFSPSWWYTFNSNKKDVKKLLEPELARRAKERKEEEARLRAEELRQIAEEEARIKAEKRAEFKRKFLNYNQSRTGIFIDAGYGGNHLNEGVNMDLTALFGLKKFFFYGGQIGYQMGINDAKNKSYYELALVDSNSKTIGKTDFIRAQAVGGATVTLWNWFRPYTMVGLGYYRNSYDKASLLYEEDSRSGGVLSQGFTAQFQPGVDIKIKKFSLGLAYRLQVDFGAGASDFYMLSLGYKFW